MGRLFKHGNLLTCAHLDCKGISGRRGGQTGVDRNARSDNFLLDIPQPAEGSFRAKGSIWTTRTSVIK
jgi:hypothetical protein